MRLDEVEWELGPEADLARPKPGWLLIRNHADRYAFYGPEFKDYWSDLDPLTAQAVLFDLCSRSDP